MFARIRRLTWTTVPPLFARIPMLHIYVLLVIQVINTGAKRLLTLSPHNLLSSVEYLGMFSQCRKAKMILFIFTSRRCQKNLEIEQTYLRSPSHP